MEEPNNKLILNSNTSLKQKKTLSSTKEKLNSLAPINSNKKYLAFKSMSKLYINSIIKNSQIESVNEKKRIAKTPNNFFFKKSDKKQKFKKSKTLQTLQKCNSKVTNESYEKSDFYIGQKIDMDLININISILASYFKSIYPDQIRIKKFNDEFKDKNIEGYEEILLLMKEFKDFNIFDYLSVSSGNTFFLSKEKQEERIKNIWKRNNIVLSLLIEHEYLKEKENNGIIEYSKNKKIFQTTEFLFPLLENFKTILIHLSDNEISFEVEVLILSLLDYNEYAQFIYYSHTKYFNDFLNKIGIKNYNFTKFLKIINEQEFDNLSKEEILIFRKIINSMAERDFYLGLDKIITNEKLCKFSSEGRLWKTMGITMEPYDIFKLWEEYKKQVDLGNIYILNRKTIDIECNQEIKNIKDELKKFNKNPNTKKEDYDKYKDLTYKLISLEKDISLPFVSDIEDLFLIFFKYNLKHLVMYFLDNLKEFSINIFEMCLAYDEDICINILDRCLKNSNVRPSYIHLCISKKFFHLARILIKFPVCKNELIKFYEKDNLQGHIGKKKHSVYFEYKEGKEDVLHFLSERKTTNFDNTIISNKNTFGLRNSRSPVHIKQSRTIIRPFDYMKKIFKKILPKKIKKKKKRNSICTPNIHTIKLKNTLFSPMSKIRKSNDYKSDFGLRKQSKKSMDNISNASSSYLQSSTTLLINNKGKKNSFFSMLNNDIRKEKFFSSNNLNTPNSNYFVDNIIIEENPESPQEKNRETVNRISKFMKMNGYNFPNNTKNENFEESREMSDSDMENKLGCKQDFSTPNKKNRSLRPRNRIRNLSIAKTIEKRRKSLKENSEQIIKKWKNEIKKYLIENGNNNISIINEERNNSKGGDSPILKIIYYTDGEDCDSNRLEIRNKSLFGITKSGRRSKSISQFDKKESSSREKESLMIKKIDKNQNLIDNSTIKDNLIFNKLSQIPLNNNNTFIPSKNNIKAKFENKRKKNKESSNYDPISKKLLEKKKK